MIYNVVLLVRLAFYLLRVCIWLTYAVLRFIAKPGSRLIVPVAGAALTFVFFDDIRPILEQFYPDNMPHDDVASYAAASIIFVVLVAAYVALSYVLAIIIGTFPTIPRPLPPIRRLAVRRTAISSVRVRVAVPPLRME